MNERLSALLDGDLDDAGMRPVFDRIRRDEEMRSKWEIYCLIGDTLRGEGEVVGETFAQRVMQQIEDEPTIVAPPIRPPVATARHGLGRVLLPMAAAMTGVAAVGWVVHSLEFSDTASGPSPVAARSAAPVAASIVDADPARQDAPYREYLFAHQGSGGGTPIPGIAQYVRTVSEVQQGVDR